MTLTQIIAEYMATHRRLVVPQLGAFLRKSEGEEILFSELLKRDDGVLLNLLCSRGMGELEAQGAIDRFIFELRHTVESGAVYRAEHLGLFAVGAQSNLCFRYLPTLESPAPEASATPSTLSPETIEQAPIPEQSVAVEPLLPASEPAEEEPMAEVELQSEEPELPTIPPAPAEEPMMAESPADGEHSAEEARRKIKALLGDHPPQVHTSSRPRPTDPSIKGLRYGKPGKNPDGYGYGTTSSSRRPDSFVILAIVAVLLALAAILYGYFNDQQRSDDPYFVGEMPVDRDPATLNDMDFSEMQP